MRQVGERLIPIGVSSSRAGSELPEGSGPGGAIILREGEQWGPFTPTGVDPSSHGRRSSRRQMQVGSDVEDVSLPGRLAGCIVVITADDCSRLCAAFRHS